MLYIIYKITNKYNGKIYIGKHQTKNINDNYMGSGKFIKHAINKYGKEAFTKEILFIFDSEKEMNEKEKEIITESFISSDKNYNAALGGEGGPHFKGRMHSNETKEKIKKSRENVIISDNTKLLISYNNRKRTITDSFREKMRIIASNRKKSDEEKLKISNSMRKNSREKGTSV